MPSTTVHLPDDLLVEIDRFVKREGISRNKFIIKACETALKMNAGRWPKDYFTSNRSEKDKQLICEAVEEMKSVILRSRKNREGGEL